MRTPCLHVLNRSPTLMTPEPSTPASGRLLSRKPSMSGRPSERRIIPTRDRVQRKRLAVTGGGASVRRSQPLPTPASAPIGVPSPPLSPRGCAQHHLTSTNTTAKNRDSWGRSARPRAHDWRSTCSLGQPATAPYRPPVSAWPTQGCCPWGGWGIARGSAY